MGEHQLEPWPLLVLARLYALGEEGGTLARVRKGVNKWLPGSRTAEQDTALKPVLDALAEQGLCDTAGTGQKIRWRVTERGEHLLADALNLQEGGKRPTWATLLKGPLMGAALGMVPRDSAQQKHLASAPGLRARLLKQAHDLPVPELPTAKQAVDALLWRQLGVETDAAFNMTEVKRHLLAQILDMPGTTHKPGPLQNMVAARAAGASRNDVSALREAVVKSWLRDPSRKASIEPAPATAAEPPPDGEAFAVRVGDAARHTPGGWFGDTLVFINHVYSVYQKRYPEPAMTINDFKNRLVEAHRRGRLELARADLVAAMDRNDVLASETRYLNGTFHFIRIWQGGQVFGGVS